MSQARRTGQAMDEIRRLVGEAEFEGGGSFHNFEFDPGVAREEMSPRVRRLIEDKDSLSAEDTATVLKSKLAPLLRDRVWDVKVWAGGVLPNVKRILIDAYSYPNDKSKWESGILENAPNQVRLSIAQWENGVPVSMSGGGETKPSGGIVELELLRYTGEVKKAKPRQMKGTPEKVAASVIKWFEKNASLFTGTSEAREILWTDVLPTFRSDDYASWASARDESEPDPFAPRAAPAPRSEVQGELQDLVEGRAPSPPRRSPRVPTEPVRGSARQVVEDLDKMLKSLRG